MITPFRMFLCTHRNCPTFPAVPLSPRAILYTPTWPTYCIDSNLGICTFLIPLQLPAWWSTFNFLFDPSDNLYFTLFYNNFITGNELDKMTNRYTWKLFGYIYLVKFFFYIILYYIFQFLCFSVLFFIYNKLFNFFFTHNIFLISF